jgi:glycosyltransferase involved in cell wall biosynthesis
MRVLHVDAGREWRGGQNQVRLTAQGMRRRGHEVVLAARCGGVLAARAREAGLTVHEVPFGSELSPRAAAAMAGVLERVQPQIVQAHDPHSMTACLLATALRPGIPIVATRRVDFAPRSFPSRLKYQLCPRVIAVSRAAYAVLERAGVYEERLRLVYEGVADRAPRPGGREALAALGVPMSAPVVGNIAALVDHKDQATLVSAAARVLAARPEVYFVIVGDGERRAALETQARELGVAGHVIFTGFRDDVDVLLPAFDVFCLSSQMEGLGTILLDAMSFGRPIVGTGAGGIPEVVEDRATGRVVPVRDFRALADALLDVLREPAQAEAMGRRGRRRFEERFSAERMVSETLSVYEELV